MNELPKTTLTISCEFGLKIASTSKEGGDVEFSLGFQHFVTGNPTILNKTQFTNKA